jgi:hypothetical protein
MAALGTGLRNPTDIVGDNCMTDIEDLAAIAAAWLDDSSLTAPVPKP